jgi:nucleotide-binding universal stress UspA family protein
VLVPWFRKPHRKYGTTSGIINLIAILQLATIVYSRGNMTILAEAYAFGVVWSFFFKALGVTVLRFQRNDQEYKTPINIHVGGREIPIGLMLTTLVLGTVAIVNLFTKQIATKYGIAFTIFLFITFTVSEKINLRRVQKEKKGLEQFNLDPQAVIDSGALHARPGCIIVAVRDFRRMEHLKRVLEKTNLRKHDIVVATVRPLSTGAAEYDLEQEQIFSDYEKELFSHVVQLAEKEGKPVELLVVPGVNPFDAIVHAANSLQASRLVTGVSARMESDELARRIGQAWEALPGPRHPFSLEIISPDRHSVFVNLGPHPPRLWPEDIDLVHDLWLELSEVSGLGSRLHHRDVVGVALRRLHQDLRGDRRNAAVEDIQRDIRKS